MYIWNNSDFLQNFCSCPQEFLRREIKPTTKVEMINGILKFLETVTVDKCRKYINHLKKVIPRIIEVNSEATGF